MMDAVDLLIEARAYIDKGWTQGAGRRDECGRAVGEVAPNAPMVVWCSYAATAEVVRHQPDAERQVFIRALELLARGIRIPGRPVVGILGWNDAEERTKEEVLEAFDRAIELGSHESQLRREDNRELAPGPDSG